MKLKSNKKFLDKCFEGKLTTTDVYTYTEKITEFDLQKLVLLKLDFLEYKKRIVLDKIGEIKSHAKFITMELNNDHIPLITNLFKKQVETDDQNVHEAIFDAEVDEFCDEFLPGYFKHFNQAERIVRLKTDQVIKEMMTTDENQTCSSNQKQGSGIEWLGEPYELVEWLKDAHLLKLFRCKSQKELFAKFQDFLNVPQFDETEKIRAIKKRKKDVAVLHADLVDVLTKWSVSDS